MIISGGPEPTVATARFIPSGDFTNRICCCIGLLALTGALQDSTPIHGAEMCSRSQLLAGALGPEQSFLHSQAASVARHRAVAATDAMTGAAERQRDCGHHHAEGAGRPRASHALREPAV